jgi:hypothetical protein
MKSFAFAFALLLFVAVNVHSSKPVFIPIAEYCVATSPSNVYLHLQKVLEERPKMIGCESDSVKASFDRTIRFLISSDLRIEQNISGFVSDDYDNYAMALAAYDAGGDAEVFQAAVDTYKYKEKIWFFADSVFVYAKNGKRVNFNKYYKKAQVVPVEWQIKVKCGSLYNAVYSGKYHIRIIGECEK